jgi:hypothetical protein
VDEHRAVIRRTAPVFAAYLLLITFGIAAAIVVGLMRAADDPGARRAAERFSAALAARDGAAACAELDEHAVAALEEQEGEGCGEAILALELASGAIARVEVAERAGKADVGGEETVFLEQGTEGWRITALGCRPVKGHPYDCEVES